jgi:hypothetical protein
LSGLDTLLPDAELPASLLRAARSFAVASIVFGGIVCTNYINIGCEVVL